MGTATPIMASVDHTENKLRDDIYNRRLWLNLGIFFVFRR